MKKLKILFIFLFLLVPSNETFARCHGHYHYSSAPVYVVRSDYFENESNFNDCKSHYLLTRTTVNFYSNGTRRTYNSHTVFNNDGSVLIADCTDIQHVVLKKQHYFLFRKGGLYYIADSQGKIFAKRNYSRMFGISENRLLVRVNKKYGIIDLQENIILPLRYKTFKNIGNNLYLTKLNGYCGIVSSSGEILIKNEYEKIKPLYDMYILKKTGKYGLADAKGKIILIADNDKIKEVGGYIVVKQDGYYKIYSTEGVLLTNKEYKKIRIERNILQGKIKGRDFEPIIEE